MNKKNNSSQQQNYHGFNEHNYNLGSNLYSLKNSLNLRPSSSTVINL